MKLIFDKEKPNTKSVSFRIDPDTNKKLDALRKYYGVRTSPLIKRMIHECYASLEVDES